MQRSDPLELIVSGLGCPLFDDPEKAVEVNEGHSLVPWCGQRSLLIDRYDCRAYLQDLTEYDRVISLNQEDYLSEEEVAIEKMCEFERYLELQVDVDDMTTQAEEQRKRELEASRCKYGAVDFSYDESNDGCKEPEVENGATGADTASHVDEMANDPYICPPELKHLTDVHFPDTDKQAQIIERTAVFVSRQGSQMEIVLKAKQTSNPLFGFLNYDHILNPFYKEMVKLIRQGRYVPKLRPSKPETLEQVEPNKSIQDDHYELKLPKVDISNTAYASLINKFKKVNEMASQAQAAAAVQPSPSGLPTKESCSPEPRTETPPAADETCADASADRRPLPPQNAEDSQSADTNTQNPANNDSVTPTKSHENPADVQSSAEEYEQCYQEYYKHYYSHYYTQFSDQQAKMALRAGTSISDEHRAAIVQQAAKAAAVAASAAVNAMYQAKLAQKSAQTNQSMTVTMTPGERGIIDKMAEYVARNGIEFEELVTRQKGGDARFAFLRPNHPHHSYYLTRRRQLLPDPPDSDADKLVPVATSHATTDTTETPTASQQATALAPLLSEAKPSDSPSDMISDRQSSISFKLMRPCSSTKLHPNGDAAPPSVYVHSSISTECGLPSSCPALGKEYNSPARPVTPMNSVASDDDASGSAGSHRDRSKSPVRFSLPGIPSASSSSASSPASSRSGSPSGSSPERSRASSPPSPVVKAKSLKDKQRSKPSRCIAKRERKLSEEPEVNPLLYPRTDIPCPYSPPSPANSPDVKSEVKSSPRTPPLGSNAIEYMLDTVETSHSPDNRKSSRTEERLRQERRRRAAQLVAQLRTGASSANVSSSSRSDHSSMRPCASMSALSVSSSPPPAPDSVPAAVAHAVVASLKRRHEESLASLEAEVKARRRMRSPPSAYALPKERSHKSSSSRDSSSRHSHSPVPRERDESPERKRSKHKKHTSRR
ncbi:splicing factor suppressor of white-apricot homolog [Clonorchis sinensis]|uniref:Splicing factor suppressor of white-apricot homolog n=1 Tax=Clonorchis sinensis TaxID=79923 RepID=H2KV76_CLOSI|nr:splicing factor suppressor of white-apricot homolog [Clonorchis sinensis]